MLTESVTMAKIDNDNAYGTSGTTRYYQACETEQRKRELYAELGWEYTPPKRQRGLIVTTRFRGDTTPDIRMATEVAKAEARTYLKATRRAQEAEERERRAQEKAEAHAKAKREREIRRRAEAEAAKAKSLEHRLYFNDRIGTGIRNARMGAMDEIIAQGIPAKYYHKAVPVVDAHRPTLEKLGLIVGEPIALLPPGTTYQYAGVEIECSKCGRKWLRHLNTLYKKETKGCKTCEIKKAFAEKRKKPINEILAEKAAAKLRELRGEK